MSKDQFSPKSSFLTLAEYDNDSRLMTVTFKNGTSYHYLNVFSTNWLSFKQSPDHSSFYSRGIKGKMISVPIAKKSIGQPKSTALKHQRQRRTLDAGVKKQVTQQENKLNGNASKRPRVPGNTPRAFGR